MLKNINFYSPSSYILTFVILLGLVTEPIAMANEVDASVQTLHNQIEAKVYSYKKTKHFIAIELGFSNPTEGYLEFTPKEIYLDDEVKYSLPPFEQSELENIVQKSRSQFAIVPAVLGIGLGIAAIATSRNRDLATGLGIAALSMGGLFVLSKMLESEVKNNRFISFEENRLGTIKRLPPGMTLGGFLFFPATKKPKSITVIAKSTSGHYEKKIFPLTKLKESSVSSAQKFRKDR